MPLAAHQLDAFHAVAATGSFSRAAARLHVSQPALSQRIQQLETELKKRLFVRSPSGVSATEAGTRLLRYCQVQRALEAELLDDLTASGHGATELELSGTLRIAAFSSVARSRVLPAVAPLFHANPRLAFDVSVREITQSNAPMSSTSRSASSTTCSSRAASSACATKSTSITIPRTVRRCAS